MPQGILHLIQAQANPQGAKDSQLFLFVGDPTLGPIREILPQEGVTIPCPPTDPPTGTRHLKILHINDLHGHFLHWTSEGNEPIFSRIAGRVRELRSRYKDDPDTAVLFMSAGDDIVGSLFDELLDEENESISMHAAYQLYSAAGVDVSALGNHDLDFGPNILAKGIQKNTCFPVLSANLRACQKIENLYYPAALFVTKGIRVGIIGLTTSAQVRQPLNTKLEITDPVTVVQNMLPAMRPLCDLVLILSHLGFSQDSRLVSAATVEVGDAELAQILPHSSIDLIVGGHTHDALNKDGLQPENIINGIPIVQSGAFGEFLGEVEITLQNGLTSVSSAGLIPTASLPDCNEFESKEIQPIFSRVQEIGAAIVGKVEDDPQLGTEVVQKSFAAGELALANFTTDGMVSRLRQAGYEVDFAMIDASSIACGVPFKKNLSFEDCFMEMPFADTVRFYQLTGAEIYDLLQDNVLRLDHPDAAHKERGFLQFSKQVRYSVDLEKEQAREILVNNIPLDEQMDAVFKIATSVFTRELAGKWEADTEKKKGISMMKLQNYPHSGTDIFLRKIFVAHIQEQGGITHAGGAQLDGRLHILPAMRDINIQKMQNHKYESRRL
jgi:2',3'-cyclic-nucleotide 2'-phosphodiesterase (5'-nucleotidase family)